MKHLVAVGTALLVVGCASIVAPKQEPLFFPSQNAAAAEGFPFERVSPPSMYSLNDNLKNNEHRSSDRSGDTSQIKIDQYAFNWESSDGSLLSLWHIGAKQGTELFPLGGSDGYEFVGNERISYWYGWGRYDEMTPEAATPITPTPECVKGVQIGATTANKRFRSIASLYEAVPCSDGAAIGQAEYAAQRERLYRLIGIK
jgi:hypothetical protein